MTKNIALGDMPISEMNLTVRSENCLKAEGIITVGQLVKHSENDLLKAPNLGRRSLNEIISELDKLGLKLGRPIPDHLNIRLASALTMRDYFAVSALPKAIEFWDKDCREQDGTDDDPCSGWVSCENAMSCIARTAYEMADAMLRAREE